jgi:transcriptional regulator with XRE-family HTH domain
LAKQRPGFKAAWEALDEEYAALDALLAARQEAGLTQEALAELMGTTKSAISRLESSFRNDRHSPSFATLKRYAHACGKKLLVQLV